VFYVLIFYNFPPLSEKGVTSMLFAELGDVLGISAWAESLGWARESFWQRGSRLTEFG
jgi:hypothetical protein